MKKNYFGAAFVLVAGLLQASCGNDAPYYGQYNNPYGYNSQYRITNGTCYSTNGQAVDMSYCMNNGGVANNGFTWSNNACYDTAGRIVASTYCSVNTGSTGAYGTSCIGTYYQSPPSQGNAQQIHCNGADCRGYNVYNVQGQMVSCQ